MYLFLYLFLYLLIYFLISKSLLFMQEAVFLLELTDGHMAFNRDEERSSLQVVRMAERCRQAVVVASSRGSK